jgi:hypothetical protein
MGSQNKIPGYLIIQVELHQNFSRGALFPIAQDAI